MTEQIMTDRERTALQLSRAREALEKVWPLIEEEGCVTETETAQTQAQPSTDDPPRWWTAQDVAKYRRVSVGTVYNWVTRAKTLRKRGERGGIPFSRPRGTGCMRFDPAAVKAFFEDEDSN